jgi:hypothetical protein
MRGAAGTTRILTIRDQRSDLGRNDGSSGLAAAHLPGPEQAKPSTMPSNDRFWLDDGERRVPATPEARQTDPQQAVSRGQFQAFCSRSPKHTDLVTQSQVLELEGGARSEDRRQSREECHKSSEHRRNYERCNSHPFRSFEVFERHNNAKVTMRRSYGFRTFRILELALYQLLGKLPEPELTHEFF